MCCANFSKSDFMHTTSELFYAREMFFDAILTHFSPASSLRVPLTIILSMCTAPCVHLSRCYLAWKIENSPHAFAFQFLFHGTPRNECLFLRCLERNFPGKRGHCFLVNRDRRFQFHFLKISISCF